MQLLRKILVIIYIVLTVIILLSFKGALPVWISFVLNALVIFMIFIYHIFYEKKFSPFLSSYIVFNYLFLFLAPLIQITLFYNKRNPTFPQYFPYSEQLTIYTNLLIILFNLTFFISYLFYKRRLKPVNIKYPIVKTQFKSLLILTLLIVSLLIFVFTFPVVLDEIVKPYWMKSNVSKMYSLVINQSLLFLPFAGIILSKYYLEHHPKKTYNYYAISLMIILFILILLWFKNPLTAKRNSLGPLYITLIFLFKPKWLNTNTKMMSFMFFSMVILFPLMAIVTHTAFSLTQIIKNPALLFVNSEDDSFLHVFQTLHYDAFANIMATIEYVSQHGFAWGKQLIGALGFFIPRSLWTSKPIGTGQLVGQYLIDQYHFRYNNLSNPLVSEAYINFSVLGVILFAILLAYMVKVMLSWLNSKHYVKKIMAFYFSVYMIFLLRGDLINGIAYFSGIAIAVLLVPFIIERLLILIYYKSHK